MKATIAATCQQDRSEANVHEVVAWRLANALGNPWDQLVPTAVLRTFDDIGPGAFRSVAMISGGPIGHWGAPGPQPSVPSGGALTDSYHRMCQGRSKSDPVAPGEN
jgi:hypothetical protein